MELTRHLISAYGCNDSEKMSDAYKETITNETLAIMNGIKNDTLLPNEFISDTIKKYSHGHRKPMSSLRDTEESVTIRID